jgi:hypothetical protein
LALIEKTLACRKLNARANVIPTTHHSQTSVRSAYLRTMIFFTR